jgi:hypothetical protein
LEYRARCCGRIAAGDGHRDLSGKACERGLVRRECTRLGRIAVGTGDQVDSQRSRNRDRGDIERRAGPPPSLMLGIDIGQPPIAFDRGLRSAFDSGSDQVVDKLGKSVLEAPSGAGAEGAVASPLRFRPDSSLRVRKASCSATNSSIDTFASR